MSRALRGTPYQEAFFSELHRASQTYSSTVRRVKRLESTGLLVVAEVSLSTSAMTRDTSGVAAQEVETVFVCISEEPSRPPAVFVNHGRFAGTPHVLTDGELCIYLDPAREWDPAAGARAFLDRLFRWFEQAVAGTFNAATALFHPVGGRAHFALSNHLVVCRDEFVTERPVSLAALNRVSDIRLDLHASLTTSSQAEQVLVLRAQSPLYAGPGSTVRELLSKLGHLTAQAGATAFVQRVKRRRRDGENTVHIVVLVPNPAATEPYLLVGRIEVDPSLTETDYGDLTIDWLPLSDERPSIATRRDKDRPVESLFGADVVVLGCGGLGSWLAEYAVRAGARSLELVDPGTVTGGLLVRQNFTEADVGMAKADALAARLRAIAPGVDITASVRSGISQRTLDVSKATTGFIFDATVSRAVSGLLEVVASATDRQALIAQVATDVATGTLGLAIVSTPSSAVGPGAIDAVSGPLIQEDGRYEPYFTFWQPRDEEELIPARGCSIPTFHGSAADLAAVAAVQVNLVAAHGHGSVSGTYVFALPHAGVEPNRAFVPLG